MPIGSKATPFTSPECPCSRFSRRGAPLAKAHTITSLSIELDAMRVPSGDQETIVTSAKRLMNVDQTRLISARKQYRPCDPLSLLHTSSSRRSSPQSRTRQHQDHLKFLDRLHRGTSSHVPCRSYIITYLSSLPDARNVIHSQAKPGIGNTIGNARYLPSGEKRTAFTGAT